MRLGKAARRALLFSALAGVFAAGASAAVAASALSGRAQLTSQPLTGDLLVLGARIEPMLAPGRSSDLIVDVRNRSRMTVEVDRVRLVTKPQQAKPAGCLAKVSGPLLATNGITPAVGKRVRVAPGAAARVVLPAALKLAVGANGGCGFKVQVDVRASQVTAPPPVTVRPTTAMPPVTSPPKAPPPQDPPPPPPPPTTTTAPPTTVMPTPPPIDPDEDCDPADPDCVETN